MAESSSKSVWPLWCAVIATSFLGGVGMASFGLRLRDRERLRRAASRTMKSLRQTQRAALGPTMNLFAGTKAPQKILVIGGGSFGTAMAYVAALNGHQVVMYMRDPKQCACINEHLCNPKHLSDTRLAPNGNAIRGIWTKTDLIDEFAQPDILVILALPCQATPDWIRAHRDMIPPTALLCSTAKGLYLPTKQLIGHAILDALERAEQPLAFLSGPSFAEEIVKEFPTSVVIASNCLFHAVRLQKLLSNSNSFRVYTSQDPVGVQLGGALKNPLAVGAGMISGIGFGSNTLSACVTRASRELCDLCTAMGGDPKTIDGLSGIGDLMLTCFSDQSRNQRCGQRLMNGESIADIQKDYTVEGVATADVAVAYADMCGLELPIFRTVHALIHKQLTPEMAVQNLMGRPQTSE